MKLSFKGGRTSKLLDIFVSDSTSIVGGGLTGLTNLSSGWKWYYYREGANATVSVSIVSMTLGTWTSGGFIVIDATNMPGCYQIGIPDAAIAAGAQSVLIMLSGPTSMAPLLIEIELTATDNQSATAFITGINSLAPPANWNSDIIQTGDAFARLGAAGAGLTALGDTRIANLDAAISSRTKPADTQAAVTLVTTTTNLTNAPLDSSGVTTLLTRLTALRAGYLDNLSAGAAALESSLQGLITTIGAAAAGIASSVWSYATRILTAGTNIVLAKGTGVTGFNDLSAAQVNTEADTALADYDAPTHTELTSELATADDAVLLAIGALSNLSQADVRTAVGLTTANLDTQLDALPTNAELATALGGADDAVLNAIAALNNLSQANIRTAIGLATANLDTQLDALPTNAELATALGTADDAVLNAIGTLPQVDEYTDCLTLVLADLLTIRDAVLMLNNLAAGAEMALTDVERDALVDAIKTVSLTETYPAIGEAPTWEQAIYMILVLLHNFKFTVPTDQSVKRIDDPDTEAMGFSVDEELTEHVRVR